MSAIDKDWGMSVSSVGKESSCMQETWVQSLGWEDPLEKGKATHSCILAWKIRWTVWGPKELDTTEQLSLFFFLFSLTGLYLKIASFSLPLKNLSSIFHTKYPERESYTYIFTYFKVLFVSKVIGIQLSL